MIRLRWHHTAEQPPIVHLSAHDRDRRSASLAADRMLRAADGHRRDADALEREAADLRRHAIGAWLDEWARSCAVPLPPLSAEPPLMWRALRQPPARGRHVPASVLDLTTPEPR